MEYKLESVFQVVGHGLKPEGPFSLQGTENNFYPSISPNTRVGLQAKAHGAALPFPAPAAQELFSLLSLPSCYLKGQHRAFASIPPCHFQDLSIGFVLEAKVFELSD